MIPLSRPSIGDEEAEAAARVVRSGWLAQGPEVAALEREFGAYLDPADPPHVVAVSSCTAALHLTLLALGVDRDRIVYCPSYTFIATANAPRYCGAHVRLVDIEPDTYNIDPALLVPVGAAKSVVLPVHQVGLPCDVDAILRTAPGAQIVEDAACAIGARYPDGARVGSRHDTAAACFSLHGSKSVVAGEGGLISTRDADLAARLRRLRSHGVDIPAEARTGAEQERYVELGYNYRMSDLHAAVARIQICKADDIVAARRRRAEVYSRELGDVAQVPRVEAGHACQRYLLVAPSPEARERVVGRLTERGISCRRGLQVVHRQPAWTADYDAPELPVTERIAACTVQLPLWADMPESDQARVIEAVREALAC